MKQSKKQTEQQVLQELLLNICHLDYSYEMLFDAYDKCPFLRISDKSGGFKVIGPTVMKQVIKSGLEFFIAGGAVDVYPRPMFID